MNEEQRKHYYGRWHDLCADILNTMGQKEGFAYIRGFGNLPKKSVARCEQIWALKKHRLEQERETAS